MKWTVVYLRSAKNDLVNFWLNANDRERVTEAGDEIDRRLSHNPVDAGESRDGKYRVIVNLPLVAYYRIEDADRRVVVTAIRCSSR
jgi:mRNA-degrading endonuclease RelE of RelBE toxin-antitoxin system